MSEFFTFAIGGTGVTVTQDDPTCQRYTVCKSVIQTPSYFQGQVWMACLLEAAKIQHRQLFVQSYMFVESCTGIRTPDQPRTFYDHVANTARSLTDILLLELQARDAAWATRELADHLAIVGSLEFETRLRKRACKDRLAWRQQAAWNLIIERVWDVIDNDTPDTLAKCFLRDRPWLRGHLLQLRAQKEAAAISDAIDDAQAQGGVVQDVGRDVTVSAARRL